MGAFDPRLEDADTLRLLETCMARLNDLVFVTEADPIDPPGPRILYVNDAFVRRTGHAREEIVGRNPRLLHGPRTPRAALERMRAAMQRGESAREEFVNYTKTGEELWLDTEIVPVADAEARLCYYLSISRDVTERKRAEVALRESEERFRLLSRATNDAIWDWNLLTDALWWGDGFETLFGFKRDEIETFDAWLARIHPEDRGSVSAGVERAIESGRESWACTYRFRKKDGNYAHVKDRGQVIRDAAGQPVRMVGGMTDATRQIVLEERLREAQRLESIGQLTGGVAHDFNNLLTVILGNAEALGEELAGTPRQQALAELILGAAQRGAELTQRLLAFSRRQALLPRAVDVDELLRGLNELLRRTLDEQIEIELALGGDVRLASVDPVQLEGALLNLCLNARDAMPDGGTLTIETGNAVLDAAYCERHAEVAPGEYVRLVVSDTGSGIAPGDLSRVFEPFFTTKAQGKGTGLGLAMVWGFVKQSGGHVSIYSEPGRGTTVRLYLPCAAPDALEPRVAPAIEEAALGSGTVLLVEDDASVRRYARGQLRSLGYEVVEAATGPQALEILRGGADVTLLFTDVVMPGGMDGRELAEAARALRPALPVLYCSGYTETTVLRNGRLEAGVHLLAKPYLRAELARKLREVLAVPVAGAGHA